jgi:putative methionine-R-sulfoxide reductase with GAF domain
VIRGSTDTYKLLDSSRFSDPETVRSVGFHLFELQPLTQLSEHCEQDSLVCALFQGDCACWNYPRGTYVCAHAAFP